MATLNVILIASLLVIAAQSAPRDYEGPSIRVERSPSCEPCEERDYGPPGPPPPPPPPPPPRHFNYPPGYRSHQWTGYSRSQDGASQGVFSGATASLNQGSQAHGEAYSVAASEAGSFSDHNQKNEGYNQVGSQNQKQLASGQDHSQGSQTGAASGQSNYHGQNSFSGQQDSSGQSSHQDYSQGSSGAAQATSAAHSQASSSAHEDLKGALQLAGQGLEASKLNSGPGCDTCGKSVYASSNARSNSGSAVAISVGG